MKVKSVRKIKWIMLFILFILLSFFSFSMILHCFDSHRGAKELLVSYRYSANIDYDVLLKENNDYSSLQLGENQLYLSSYIDQLKMRFHYENIASKKMNVIYHYDIVGRIVTLYNYNDHQEKLWTREYPILSKKDVVSSYINEEVSIPYQAYNNVALDFQRKNGVLLDAYLEVEMKVHALSSVSNDVVTYTDEGSLTLKIPLLKNVVKVEKSLIVPENKNIYDTEIVALSFNYPLFILSFLLLIFSLICATIIASHFLIVDRKNEYVKTKRRILNRYGDIIAEVSSMPEIDSYEVIEIKYFEDLVNIEEELRSPILLYEEKEALISTFLVYDREKVYRYRLIVSKK